MLKRAAFALSLLAVLAFAGSAFAGKNSASSSIIGPYLVAASPSGSPLTATSTSTPHYGDTVTFTVSTTATYQPFVNLVCYQGDALALNSWDAYFGPLSGQTFVLGSGMWAGGAADCTAYLGLDTGNKYKVLASTSFHVDAY